MKRILALLGPTASGKTEVAIDIAQGIDAEIISVDSMQIYRGMDIGTAKPTALERRGVPHHMIDLVEPEEEYSVAEFRREAREIIDEHADTRFLITGGSGLHFRAVVDPLSFAPTDPALREELEAMEPATVRAELEAADSSASEHVDLANPRRVIRAVEILRLTGETPSHRAASAEAENLRLYRSDLDFFAVGVDPGELLDDRVERRLNQMRAGGLVEEVASLRERLGRTARSAVGYREIAEALEAEGDLDAAFELTARNTKKLAKKQRTWFQRDPRIRWIPWLETPDERAARVREVFDESD